MAATNFDSTEFRSKLSGDLASGKFGSFDNFDDEDYGAESPAKEQPEEVSSPPPSVSEATPTPSAPSQSDEPPSWFQKYAEQERETRNTFYQAALARQSQAPQEVAPTGVQQLSDDNYFMNRGEMLQTLRPIVDQVAWAKQTIGSIQEQRIVSDFERAEKAFREKHGNDFDQYVKPELRQAALKRSREAARTGSLQTVDWDGLFQQELDVNETPVLREKVKKIQETEEQKKQQQAELNKVSGMPKGTTTHQAPVASKRERKPGEGRLDGFRDNVSKLLRARRAEG